MTRLAALAERSAVLVVLAMAAIACGRHAFVLARHVTGGALDLDVTALQLEFGFLVVVEANLGPLDDVMARLAFDAQATLVHVVLLMTSVTKFWRIAILFATDMTGFAFHWFMRAVEFEFS